MKNIKRSTNKKQQKAPTHGVNKAEKNLVTTHYPLFTNQGIASLPAMLLFGGIIIEIAIASAFLVFYLNSTIYGTRLGNEALGAAQAGIDDGILQIILDKSCPNAGCPASYTISIGNRTVDVVICKDFCQGPNTHEITATGKALTRRHKIVAILNTNPNTGLISIQSIREEEI
jgi:hypothetical protein